jgi:hypothetical protein
VLWKTRREPGALHADPDLLDLVVESVRIAPSDELAPATIDDVLEAIDWCLEDKERAKLVLALFSVREILVWTFHCFVDVPRNNCSVC